MNKIYTELGPDREADIRADLALELLGSQGSLCRFWRRFGAYWIVS